MFLSVSKGIDAVDSENQRQAKNLLKILFWELSLTYKKKKQR